MCLQDGETDASGAVQPRNGETLVDAIAALAGRDVAVLSIMHTDVRHIDACLDIVDAHWSGLVGVYAHSGRFVDGAWVFEGTISPSDYAAASRRWLGRNVQVVGGCCGIRPDHIAALSAVFREGSAETL